MGDQPERRERGTAARERAVGRSYIDDFAAAVSHELRTPLAVVAAAASTARTRLDDLERDGILELLGTIERNASTALTMLERLGRAADVGRGTVTLDVERFDLAELAAQTVSDLRRSVLAQHLTEVLADQPVIIEADATAVREIIFNLLSNAAKYSDPHTHVRLTITADGGTARLTVRDHGHGIAPGDTERIFEKYSRAAEGNGHGAGLGLYIARGLARTHGGDLTVRSAGQDGSEFVLTLPLARPT